MADLQNALEKALYDRLTAIVTGATVAQHVEQDTPSPLVIIGEITRERQGGKSSQLDRFEIDIVTEISGNWRNALNALQTQVLDALDGWRPANTAGVLFGEVRALSSTGLMGPDGETYFGSQRFQIFVQPA